MLLMRYLFCLRLTIRQGKSFRTEQCFRVFGTEELRNVKCLLLCMYLMTLVSGWNASSPNIRVSIGIFLLVFGFVLVLLRGCRRCLCCVICLLA